MVKIFFSATGAGFSRFFDRLFNLCHQFVSIFISHCRMLVTSIFATSLRQSVNYVSKASAKMESEWLAVCPHYDRFRYHWHCHRMVIQNHYRLAGDGTGQFLAMEMVAAPGRTHFWLPGHFIMCGLSAGRVCFFLAIRTEAAFIIWDWWQQKGTAAKSEVGIADCGIFRFWDFIEGKSPLKQNTPLLIEKFH
jgi:hypothetical protein